MGTIRNSIFNVIFTRKMAEKPLLSGWKWFLRWFFLGFGDSLYWKVFSEFWNCGRKWCFWDIAISAILRNTAQIAISQKRHFRPQFQNSENTFQYKLPPQNLWKITSETTFGHSKVVFRPFYAKKRENFYAYTPNGQFAPFGILSMLIQF